MVARNGALEKACGKKNNPTPDKQDSTCDIKSKIYVVVPFVQGVSEKIKRVYSQ